jgi:hypothetical protein
MRKISIPWLGVVATLLAAMPVSAQDQHPLYQEARYGLSGANHVLGKFTSNRADVEEAIKTARKEIQAATDAEVDACVRAGLVGCKAPSQVNEDGPPLHRAHLLLSFALDMNTGKEDNATIRPIREHADQHIKNAIQKVEFALKLQEEHPKGEGSGHSQQAPSGGAGSPGGGNVDKSNHPRNDARTPGVSYKPSGFPFSQLQLQYGMSGT